MAQIERVLGCFRKLFPRGLRTAAARCGAGLILTAPLMIGVPATCRAQPSAATVTAETLSVRAEPFPESKVRKILKRGDAVTLEFSVAGGDGMWCSVSVGKPTVVTGYTECGGLQRISSEPLPATSAGRGGPAPTDAVVEEFMALSGLRDQIRQISNTRALSSSGQGSAFAGPHTAELVGLFKESFRPRVFSDAVKASLKRNCPADAFPQLLEWYRTPLGRKITRDEVQTNSQDNLGAMMSYMNSLRSNPPPQGRVDLVQRLEQIVDMPAVQTEMSVAVMRALAQVMNPKLPPEKRLTEDKLDQMTGQVRQSENLTAEMRAVRLLYTYRGISDDELEQYVRLWDTTPGRTVRNAVYEGLTDAVSQASVSLVETSVALHDKKPQ